MTFRLVPRSCDGEILSARAVPVRTGGLQVEYESPDAPIRTTAFGGVTSVSGDLPGAEFAKTTEGGPFLGGLVAYEGGWLGVGAGPVLLPAEEYGLMPSLYLRLGGRDGVHVQGDFLAPTPMPGATGLARAGIGFAGARTSGLVGLSLGRALDLSDEGNAGPFAELAFVLTPGFETLVAGSWFDAEVHSDWGAGVGVRWRPEN